MNFPRKAGVVLHPTSLPGSYGIGEIGPHAREFARTLEAAGQRYWQVLPLGPTGYADSPYQSLSTFAGNAMLISFDDLREEGLVRSEELGGASRFPVRRVEYGEVLGWRGKVLERVCEMFSRRATSEMKDAFEEFCAEEGWWLEDYALFMALKELHELRPWTEWDSAWIAREPGALQRGRREHRKAIRRVKLCQFLFDRQWRRLREDVEACGIQLIGDLPIFVSHDSADVWANQELFHLDAGGCPTVVAGVPPDYFSATGQRWGNPLYRWDVHGERGYDWWMKRMGHLLSRVDIVRIDHFRGFESYWEIPAEEPTAMNGRWVKGPGEDFFRSMRRELGELPVIAEDLGVITEEVDALREGYGLPGMRILHFSFAEGLEPHLRPEGFPENCVVYTGTHDNDTTQGWFWREAGEHTTETAEEIDAERKRVLSEVNTDGRHIHWDLIALAHRLKPHTAMVPLQDVMGLGSEARMNVPGRMEGNWSWRFAEGDLRGEDVQRLREITEWGGRL